MKWQIHVLLYLVTLTVPGMAWGQQSQPSTSTSPAKVPPKQEKKSSAAADSAPKSDSSTESQEPQTIPLDPDTELQIAVQQAGNDPAALVRNLEAFLVLHPDSPRRVAIYRALTESEMQSHNQKLALDYAEKVIALQPDDIQAMFLATTILEQMPDDANQIHAIDYATRMIDGVVKADPDSRPQNMTLDDWQTGRIKFETSLYVLRGRMERHLRKNDDASKDFAQGSRLLPNSEAALNLGEIAEEQKRADEAIRQYALAFFLSGIDPSETPVNRDSLRLRIGNLWRLTHDSNAGLGDVLLDTFDKSKALAMADKPEAITYNKGVTDPLQFTLRRVDGNGTVKTADTRGKIVILNFWTTWCAYCRTMESMLADVRKKLGDRNDVVSLAVNADEDEALVGPFLKTQNLDGTLVFADGLDHALHVASIPTIIVLDRSGKVAYRSQGFAPEGFVDAVPGAIAKASTAPAK